MSAYFWKWNFALTVINLRFQNSTYTSASEPAAQTAVITEYGTACYLDKVALLSCSKSTATCL